MPKTYVLNDFKAKAVEEKSVVIELGDGSSITIPPAETLSDEVVGLINGEGHGVTQAEICRAIVGEEAYERFAANGGNAQSFLMILADANGVTLGNS